MITDHPPRGFDGGGSSYQNQDVPISCRGSGAGLSAQSDDSTPRRQGAQNKKERAAGARPRGVVAVSLRAGARAACAPGGTVVSRVRRGAGMNRLVRLFGTSIGRKLMTALSGLLLVAFLAGHALGNLTLFQGRDALNAYAHWLQGHPLLWLFRIGLLLLFTVHVTIAVRLALENREARPAGYRRRQLREAGYASRTMILSGGLVLAFLAFHLLHLTLGVVEPEAFRAVDPSGRADVYGRVIHAFGQFWLVLLYLAGLALLGLHLRHAIGSLFQTLGFNHESYETLLCLFSGLLALIIVAAFATIPLAVAAGWVGGAPGGAG